MFRCVHPPDMGWVHIGGGRGILQFVWRQHTSAGERPQRSSHRALGPGRGLSEEGMECVYLHVPIHLIWGGFTWVVVGAFCSF